MTIYKNLMMKLIRNISSIGLFFSFLLLQSCVTDLIEDTDDLTNGDFTQSWAFPILHSTATLSDIGNIEDIETTEEGLIRFAMQKDSIFSIQVDEVVELDQQVPFYHTMSFEDVVIPDFSTTGETSFNDMFDNVNTAAANAIIALHGSTGLVPAFSFTSGGTYDADSIAEYDWIEIESGSVDVEVFNTSNIPLINVAVDVFGLNGSSLAIGTINFATIPASGSAVATLDLAGKIIDNNISFEISSFSSTGSISAGVIDLNEKLEFTFTSNSIKVIRGVADFDQPFYTGNFDYHLTDSDSVDLASQFTKVRLKSGTMFYSISPGLTESTLLEVRIPNSDDGTGNEIALTINLTPNGTGNITGSIPLANTEFLLDQNIAEPFNNLGFEFSTSFYESSTGVSLRSFDLTENFSFIFNLSSIEFEYIEGYFENKTINLDQSVFQWGSDLFNTMSGEVNIANPELSMITNSSLGIQFGLDVDGVAKNLSGDSVTMIFDEIAILNGPNVAQAGQKIKDSFLYTKDNSNVENIIPILPNRFVTSGDLLMNPTNTDLNFAYDTSSVQVHLRMALPMEMIGGNIHIEDRQKFDQDGYSDLIDIYESEVIEAVKLHFEMENAFPFAANVSLVLIDSLDGVSETTLDTINLPFLVNPAGVDADGVVNEPSFANVTVELNDSERAAMQVANVSILVIDLTPNADDPDSEVIKVFEVDYLKTRIGIEINSAYDLAGEDE